MKRSKKFKPGSVVLAYCHTGIVHHPFMDSVTSFLVRDAHDKGLVTNGGRVIATSSAYIPEARNCAVKEFLKEDHEWLWFLDYDVRFPVGALYELLDKADPVERPIIGALYFVKLFDKICPVFFDRDENGGTHPILEFSTGEVRQIFSTGMGCTLIHRSVLEKMQVNYLGPWHWFGHDHVGDDVCGEDITFCRRAQQLGFTIWGHTGVLLEHHKTFAMGLQMFANQPDFVERLK